MKTFSRSIKSDGKRTACPTQLLLPLDFLVSLTHSQASSTLKTQEEDQSSKKCLESLKSSSPNLLLGRTCQILLKSTPLRTSGTTTSKWKISGTPPKYSIFRLQQSERGIDATGSFSSASRMLKLLPTPTTQEADTVKLLPTPLASDQKDRGGMYTPCQQRRIALGRQIGLSSLVKQHKETGSLNVNFVEFLMGLVKD